MHPILQQVRNAWKYGYGRGYCELCARQTLFIADGDWYREHYKCRHCASIPRWRALFHVLEQRFPDWRQRQIHESSPSGRASSVIEQQCPHYSASHYYPNRAPGEQVGAFQNQDLEALTLADHSVDLFITQDVFEHLFNPQRAWQELARVLSPGGAHVFTIPYHPHQASRPRARIVNGQIEHLLAAEYHGNPVSADGSLVVTDWGHDMIDIIRDCSGLETEIVDLRDQRLGIEGECLEIFISYKPRAS